MLIKLNKVNWKKDLFQSKKETGYNTIFEILVEATTNINLFEIDYYGLL